MSIDEFVDRLKSVKRTGTGFMALCPAHDDHSPSLSVTAGSDGRILIKCHSGCGNESIVESLGLEMQDLFEDGGPDLKVRPSSNTGQGQQPIDANRVENLHAALTMEQRAYLSAERMLTDTVIDRYRIGFEERNNERRITIPIADENGVFKDVRRWLHPKYRREGSPKILHWGHGYGTARIFPADQLKADDLVLCEGELDALALIAQGIPAVTATCGASTWPDSLSERFQGKTVTLLLDNDGAGEKGAQKRAESLSRHGVTVKIAKWPRDRRDQWDVTDELREHGVEFLKVIVAAAERCEPEPAKPAKGASGGFAGSSVGHSDEEWPDPVPLPEGLPPVEPFDFDLLPQSIRGWVADIAERMQCPPDYVAVGAVICLGAIVGRQMGIRPKLKDDWLVTPNVWGVTVGPPGQLKSPALKEVLRPLQRLEANARTEHEAAMLDFAAEKMVADAEKKSAEEKIRDLVKKGGK